MKHNKIIFAFLVLFVAGLTCAAFPSGNIQPAEPEIEPTGTTPPWAYPTPTLPPDYSAYPPPPEPVETEVPSRVFIALPAPNNPQPAP